MRANTPLPATLLGAPICIGDLSESRSAPSRDGNVAERVSLLIEARARCQPSSFHRHQRRTRVRL
jgi:hypothetical protein